MRLKVIISHDGGSYFLKAMISVQQYLRDTPLILQFNQQGIQLYPRLSHTSCVTQGTLFQISLDRFNDDMKRGGGGPTLSSYTQEVNQQGCDSNQQQGNDGIFKEYLIKVGLSQQVLKFQIPDISDLIELFRMALENQNASLCIKLKKSVDKTKYHAKLVISSVLTESNDGADSNLMSKSSKRQPVICLTNCVLNVNLQSPEAVPYFTLDIGNFPLSTSLSSRNQKALYLASSIFYPLIKDYAITSNSSARKQFQCSIAALFTNEQLQNFELTEKANRSKRNTLQHSQNPNQDYKINSITHSDEAFGALVLSGQYQSNGFQIIQRHLIQIMENDSQADIFKFDMYQKDFDVINAIMHKMSTGNRKIKGCFKLNQQQTIYRVQMLYNEFQNVQVQVIGKVSTLYNDDQVQLKDNLQSVE